MKLPRIPELRPAFGPTSDRDAQARLVHGLVSVPDGLAAGLLAGVNPVAGLYGYMVGTFVGAFATSSVFMSVQATGAMAVIIADTPGVHSGPQAGRALATLAVLTGLVMLAAGVARLGSLVRFVPNAVLTGFVNAVAVNIVLGQLSNFTGFDGQGANRVLRALHTLVNVLSFDWATVAIGLATLVLILWLARTRLKSLGLFVAVVVTSALVPLLGWDSGPQLRDIADVPGGLPRPVFPSLVHVPAMLLPAVSLAFVGLIQGAAISQSVPNPDGTYPDVSGDFRGQGIANIASGVFQGLPVGGSMSATALVTTAGAQGRLANITAGLVMAVVIVLAGDAAGLIAMPALAALLMLIGVRTLKVDNVLMVWRTGTTQATVMATTFLLTLVTPMQYAVLIGVGISVILFVARQSNRVTVQRWTFLPGKPFPIEVPPPKVLPQGEVVILAPYGSLFFASAPIFEAQLPVVKESSSGSVVILRLRGKEDLGSTFIGTITRYHEALVAAGSHLVLAGVGDRVLDQLEHTGVLEILGPDNVFAAHGEVGKSVIAAQRRAAVLMTPDQHDQT